MKNFRTLEIAAQFYRQCRALALPQHLKDQLVRAASSIALNLAEGRGKPTVKDQRRFFNQAMGSLRECQAIFMLEGREGSPEWNALDRLGANLYCLIKSAG